MLRNLKHMASGCALALLCGSAFADHHEKPQPVDPLMGDWKGSFSLLGNDERPAAVRMIPMGKGTYLARIFSTFQKRESAQFELSGSIKGGRFAFIDAVSLDEAGIAGFTPEGIILKASLWRGALKDGGVNGSVHGIENGSFELKHTPTAPSPTLGRKAPEGAVVLFDGKNLDHWTKRAKGDADAAPASWKVENGVMEVNGGGDVVTKETFGDHELHLEFRSPYMPTARGQGRGNSGVYLQSRYEVQVLDSYGLDGADNECGGIYKVAKPKVNMCAPPTTWQTYDITFHAAKFKDGKKEKNAKIPVLHNGVAIHEEVDLPGPTGGAYVAEM